MKQLTSVRRTASDTRDWSLFARFVDNDWIVMDRFFDVEMETRGPEECRPVCCVCVMATKRAPPARTHEGVRGIKSSVSRRAGAIGRSATGRDLSRETQKKDEYVR